MTASKMITTIFTALAAVALAACGERPTSDDDPVSACPSINGTYSFLHGADNFLFTIQVAPDCSGITYGSPALFASHGGMNTPVTGQAIYDEENDATTYAEWLQDGVYLEIENHGTNQWVNIEFRSSGPLLTMRITDSMTGQKQEFTGGLIAPHNVVDLTDGAIGSRPDGLANFTVPPWVPGALGALLVELCSVLDSAGGGPDNPPFPNPNNLCSLGVLESLCLSVAGTATSLACGMCLAELAACIPTAGASCVPAIPTCLGCAAGVKAFVNKLIECDCAKNKCQAPDAPDLDPVVPLCNVGACECKCNDELCAEHYVPGGDGYREDCDGNPCFTTPVACNEQDICEATLNPNADATECTLWQACITLDENGNSIEWQCEPSTTCSTENPGECVDACDGDGGGGGGIPL